MAFLVKLMDCIVMQVVWLCYVFYNTWIHRKGNNKRHTDNCLQECLAKMPSICLQLLVLLFSTYAIADSGVTPVVLWHGMGDGCCFPFSLGNFKNKLNSTLGGAYILSLQIGANLIEDMESGYFKHPDEQVKMVCDIVSADQKLSNGFNAIGFSQGGQFLRALVQRCPKAKVKNLISLGGQHQGVYGLPRCDGLSHVTCDYIRRLLNHAAYLDWVQKALVQATYWHDPLNEELYRNASTFIADINNERTINTEYIGNLQKLDNFVLVRFNNDTMVQPVDSEWFGFYKPGQSAETETLEESSIFINDRLGLKQMKEQSKLHFLAVNGNHLRFKWDWFVENVVEKFLKN